MSTEVPKDIWPGLGLSLEDPAVRRAVHVPGHETGGLQGVYLIRVGLPVGGDGRDGAPERDPGERGVDGRALRCLVRRVLRDEPPEGTVELYSTVQLAVSPTAATTLVTPVQVLIPESEDR